MVRAVLASVILAFSSHAMAKMTIASQDFKNNGKLSKDFSCEGKKISPELNWSNVPKNAKSLVLIENDPDVKAIKGGFDHWVVFNIPAEAKNLPQQVKELPEGAVKGQNSHKSNNYLPACPSTGNHHYVFNLYALDTTLDLKEGATKQEVMDKMKGHLLEKASITGLYQKEKQEKLAVEKKKNGKSKSE